MIDTIIKFSQTSLGTILIRVSCILFIGAMGLKIFVMKISDLFELYTKGIKAKKAIELFSDIFSFLGTIALSILVSYVYRKEQTNIYLILEGVFYGLGAIGIYQLFIDGRLIKFIKALRKK